jgi:hypothetical protein
VWKAIPEAGKVGELWSGWARKYVKGRGIKLDEWVVEELGTCGDIPLP